MVTEIAEASLITDFKQLRENFKDIVERGIAAFQPPETIRGAEDAYARFVQENNLGKEERLLILISLAQYLDPALFGEFSTKSNALRLVQCSRTGQLLPTGETFLALVAAGSIPERINAHRYLDTEHFFYKKSVIGLGEVSEGLSGLFGVLKLTATYRDHFLYNRQNKPRFSAEFPAHLLETNLGWDDLIINPSTTERLQEIKAFLDHAGTLKNNWGLSRHMKQGYRCLFYGPSGTGKTLAATLLGKHVGREVYRVDLSSVISKYVGETSRNLNALFNTAEDKDWILFFDEGDALFGKRVDTAGADDKNSHFANQDIAFLLQRIENYNGLVVVASNFKKNMDEAFSRRFQGVVHFDILNEELRQRYWQDNIPANATLGGGIDLALIAKRHPLSQASIINIISRASLQAIRKNSTEIKSSDLELCIKDELIK